MADLPADGDGESRIVQDFAPWSHGVTIPVPAEIAAQFPPVEGQTPHVTLVHAEWASPEQTAQILAIVEDEADSLLGETLTLGDLSYFDQFDRRVAFVAVDVSAGLRAARERIAKRIADLDIEVSRMGEDWVPHATLSMLPLVQDFIGTTPAGTWDVDEIRVQRGDEWRTVTAPEVAAESREDGQQPLFTAEDLAWVRQQRAAAVHTESRNLIECVRADRAELGEAIQVHQANGWRRYPVLYSRSGNVQEYPGPNGTVVREFRPEDVVRSRVSMDTGVGVPWELRHSPDLLSPDTVRGVAEGTALTVEAHADGIHTSGIAQAWGRPLFDAIDAAAAHDLSVAFNVKVDRRPGTSDFGDPFDQRVVVLVWNSLASVPHGRAGTARVLTPRADATDGTWVSHADALLDIAARATPPTRPIYFDRSSWVRADSARTRKDESEQKDGPPMNLLKMMMAAAGMDAAALAEKMGATEEVVMALLSGDAEMTDEQMVMITEALVPRGETDAAADPAAPPADEPADPAMDAEDSELVKGLRSLLEAAEGRADAATRKADKAEAIAEKRKDAMDDMIPRADAVKMAADQALVAGDAMNLARRALGNDWVPTPRKDAEDADMPVMLDDWQRGAILGAFGDKTQGILDRIDAAPEAVRPHLLAERVGDAREILDNAAHTSTDVIASIARNREANADGHRRDADSTDSLAAAKQGQRDLAAGKTQPSSTQGAA